MLLALVYFILPFYQVLVGQSQVFSIEYRKNQLTKVINLAIITNYALRQYSEPIKTRSEYNVADVKRGKTRASESQLVLVLLLIG